MNCNKILTNYNKVSSFDKLEQNFDKLYRVLSSNKLQQSFTKTSYNKTLL